jgi:hypothetical protein
MKYLVLFLLISFPALLFCQDNIIIKYPPNVIKISNNGGESWQIKRLYSSKIKFIRLNRIVKTSDDYGKTWDITLDNDAKTLFTKPVSLIVSNNYFNIKISDININQDEFELIDLNGHCHSVQYEQTDEENITIHTLDIPNGLYSLVIKSNGLTKYLGKILKY